MLESMQASGREPKCASYLRLPLGVTRIDGTRPLTVVPCTKNIPRRVSHISVDWLATLNLLQAKHDDSDHLSLAAMLHLKLHEVLRIASISRNVPGLSEVLRTEERRISHQALGGNGLILLNATSSGV